MGADSIKSKVKTGAKDSFFQASRVLTSIFLPISTVYFLEYTQWSFWKEFLEWADVNPYVLTPVVMALLLFLSHPILYHLRNPDDKETAQWAFFWPLISLVPAGAVFLIKEIPWLIQEYLDESYIEHTGAIITGVEMFTVALVALSALATVARRNCPFWR